MPIYKINESSDMLITEGVVTNIINSIKKGINAIKNSFKEAMKNKLEKGCGVDYVLRGRWYNDPKILIDEAYCDPRSLKLFVRYVKESEKLFDELGDIFKELEKIYKLAKGQGAMWSTFNSRDKIYDRAESFSKKCKKILEDGIGKEFSGIKDRENMPVDAKTVEIYINKYRKSLKTLSISIEKQYKTVIIEDEEGNSKTKKEETKESKERKMLYDSLVEVSKVAEKYITISYTDSPNIANMLRSIRIKGKFSNK